MVGDQLVVCQVQKMEHLVDLEVVEEFTPLVLPQEMEMIPQHLLLKVTLENPQDHLKAPVAGAEPALQVQTPQLMVQMEQEQGETDG